MENNDCLWSRAITNKDENKLVTIIELDVHKRLVEEFYILVKFNPNQNNCELTNFINGEKKRIVNPLEIFHIYQDPPLLNGS